MYKITLVLSLLFLFSATIWAQSSKTLYNINGLAKTLSKVDLEQSNVVNDFAITGDVPNRIKYNDGKIYLVNSTPASIQVFNAQSHKLERTITLESGSNPWDMVFTATNKAYVSNLLKHTVTVLDMESGKVVKEISVNNSPEDMLVVNNTVYVASTGGYPSYEASAVSVIDALSDTLKQVLAMPKNAQSLALAPDGNIHVVCTGNYVDTHGAVAVINPFAGPGYTPAVVDTIQLGGAPGSIAITKEGKGYLGDWGNGTNGYLYTYETGTGKVLNDSKNPVLVGNGIMNLFYDAMGDKLFISAFADDKIQKIDTEVDTVLVSYQVGDGPQDLVVVEAINKSDAWADSVVAFTPGTGAGFGSNYFPNNVLGAPDPDPTLSETNASSKPQEILSLGHGGEIILKFTDNYIYDGPGVDFTVFENVFLNFSTQAPFIEAAHVAVSKDGNVWHTFKGDTSDFSGFAGVTPTKDNHNPTDPAVSGGDSFDLKDVNLDWIRYVKLTDIGDLKKEGAFNGDFDLDAVVAVNSKDGAPLSLKPVQKGVVAHFALKQNYPNPFNPTTKIEFSTINSAQIEIAIYNMAGQKVKTLLNQVVQAGNHSVYWNGRNALNIEAASGVYLYILRSNTVTLTKRMILLR